MCNSTIIIERTGYPTAVRQTIGAAEKYCNVRVHTMNNEFVKHNYWVWEKNHFSHVNFAVNFMKPLFSLSSRDVRLVVSQTQI